MTRSDLINSLGVCSRLSHNALTVARFLEKKNLNGVGNGEEEEEKEDDDDNEEEVESEEEDESSTSSNDEEEEEEEEEEAEEEEEVEVFIPCKSKDIGGFYSAFCSLGSRIEIGTKVSFVTSN